MAIMLEDLGNIGDFLGGIGVVVTLIYLALQIRQNSSQLVQNTKAVQSTAYQAITQNHRAYNEWFVVHRDVAELLVKASLIRLHLTRQIDSGLAVCHRRCFAISRTCTSSFKLGL